MFFDEPTRWGINITWMGRGEKCDYLHIVEQNVTVWRNYGIHFSQSFGECAYIYILCYLSWGRIHVHLYLHFLEGYIATVCCHFMSCEAHLNCLLFWLSTVWGHGAAFLPWIVKNILYQASPTNPKPVCSIHFITL
jgi:hypothetical protein